ncbi:hypothetical protein DSO57_1030558 [Entomophthora muscae]|uniref:Uncharacterized protein n=1 Tax=Entomophthora muscae TaxID=34485 RepID=A0ACC2SQ78_9FUNG|nr:hypothetical protein DSO57_1030558 [Entomophthora muscae]
MRFLLKKTTLARQLVERRDRLEKNRKTKTSVNFDEDGSAQPQVSSSSCCA